ncbi:MAG TPA: ATP-binding protein [Chloroflexota bacterium]
MNAPLVVQRTTARRWVIVALAISLVLWLAQASLARQEQPWLGLSAAMDTDELIVGWVQPGGWAWDSGVRPGDRVLGIDGRLVAGPGDAGLLINAQSVEVRSPSGAIVSAPAMTQAFPDSDLLRLAFLLTAGSFLLVGGVIYVIAAERRAATLVLAHAASGAVLLSAGFATRSGASWALAVVYIGLVSFGGSTLLLALVFPIDRLRAAAGRGVLVTCMGVHLALIAAYGYVLLDDSAAYEQLLKVCFLILAVDLVGAVSLLVAGMWATPVGRRARRQLLTLIVLGMVAGCLPFALLSLLPFALGLGSIVPAYFAVTTMVLAPASFGVAILSRQFFGIERIVRRGLVALVVWVGLLAAYVVGVAVLARAIPLAFDRTLLAVLLTAGTFPFLQARARSRLEQLLFRDRYVYAQAVEQIGREIVALRGVESIAQHVVQRLGSTLDLSWATLTFAPHDGAGAEYAWGNAGLPTREAAACHGIERLIADGVEIGRLAVGPKQQDIELLDQDRALIRSLAPLVATALQSAARERHLEHQVRLLHNREDELVALSARLMHVQEEDRRALALDLHDDPLQRAILLARELGEQTDEGPATRWRHATDEIIASLRAISAGLRPRVLDDLGLEAGIAWLVNDLRVRSDMAVSLCVSCDDGGAFERVQPDLEIALFRVAQEALSNCLKHAEAATVSVDLMRGAQGVRLEVLDDGTGLRAPSGDQPTTGILGMRERLRKWGGDVSVESLTPRGTRVVAVVACTRC